MRPFTSIAEARGFYYLRRLGINPEQARRSALWAATYFSAPLPF